ncbi:hypothetical protein BGW37DRAFT_482495 [Umbelopsis sp. PMI_123]|nr:hypothetical protein BGW37DRAFT_482495 [Umbelopsis sp. PMI_123]
MRTSLILSTVALAFTLGTTADHITIESPPQDAHFDAAKNIEVRYRVQYQDMALLGSAATSLLYPNGTIAVGNFSSATHDDWNETRMVSFNWTIPQHISDGSYVLQVAGPAGYRCSKNNDGKAPWTRCYLTLTSQVNITIGSEPGVKSQVLNSGLLPIKNQTSDIQLIHNASVTLNPKQSQPSQLNNSAGALFPSISPKINVNESKKAAQMNFVQAAANDALPVQLTLAYFVMTLFSTMYVLQ